MSKEFKVKDRTMRIDIYTDGSASPNDGTGVGGWAAILIAGDHRKEIYGRLLVATNNIAELTAAIEGLKSLKGNHHHVVIHTDSQYVMLAIQGIKHPTANFELLREFHSLKQRHIVEGSWIRGHTGQIENERCDQLARSQYMK